MVVLVRPASTRNPKLEDLEKVDCNSSVILPTPLPSFCLRSQFLDVNLLLTSVITDGNEESFCAGT